MKLPSTERQANRVGNPSTSLRLLVMTDKEPMSGNAQHKFGIDCDYTHNPGTAAMTIERLKVATFCRYDLTLPPYCGFLVVARFAGADFAAGLGCASSAICLATASAS